MDVRAARGSNEDCGGSGWSAEIGPTSGIGRGAEKPIDGLMLDSGLRRAGGSGSVTGAEVRVCT